MTSTSRMLTLESLRVGRFHTPSPGLRAATEDGGAALQRR